MQHLLEKPYVKCSLLCASFLLFFNICSPIVSLADVFSPTCLTSGFNGLQDFSISCDASPVSVAPTLFVSADRTQLSLVTLSPFTGLESSEIYDSLGNDTDISFSAYNSLPDGLLSIPSSSLSDGAYFTYISYHDLIYPAIPFYVKNGLYYLSLSDENSQGSGLSTTSPLLVRDDGNIIFGIAIIIFFLAYFFMGSLFSAFGLTSKKWWA